MEITYDELTDNTNRVLYDISSFLNLKEPFANFENKALKIHEQKSEIKNMDFKSIDCLNEVELVMINDTCGITMTRLGLKIVTKG